MSKKEKKKKEKITYVDDGRSLYDMSGTKGGMFSSLKSKKSKKIADNGNTPIQTYFQAVKMMFVPMLVVIGIISLIFLLMYLSML